MKNSSFDQDELAHLNDLQQACFKWHKTVTSKFYFEEEWASFQEYFPENAHTLYVGGYPEARKKKLVFRYDEDNQDFDLLCLKARIDQRFRKITHRDVLGALMNLQIERHSFGDHWVEENAIYLYTNQKMGQFICDTLHRVNQLSVQFEIQSEFAQQHFERQEFTSVVASLRMDAIVASLAHTSRAKAKLMIQQGNVQLAHRLLVAPDKICHNNDTISIRKVGRFTFIGVEHTTKSDRIVARFWKEV